MASIPRLWPNRIDQAARKVVDTTKDHRRDVLMNRIIEDRSSRFSFMTNRVSHSSSRDCRDKQALEARALKIVGAAQAGSAAAFDELQRLYSARLFQIVLRITKNREDAEDALQDTFLRAFVALRKFEARSGVYSWLTRIAINSSLMILRRRRARPEAILSSFFETEDPCVQLEIRDTAPDPEQMCQLGELSNNLMQAVKKLKPVLRTPIQIRLEAELSVKDLADALNISVPAAKARLFRARACLATRLKRSHVANGPMPHRLVGTGLLARRQNRDQGCPTC
jgi:RNA polymerase sigma-70 factor, ECF subfamily